ncbi:MAG: 4Fe-4S binding protein [Planctomycetota bacterium]|nr:4Fe-4S binding protein [Planctomycetota bacterium]
MNLPAPHVNRLKPLTIRRIVQAGFVVFFILVGVQFHRFVVSLSAEQAADVAARPPAAEAFLPISSLMSLACLLKGGGANHVRPAGLVIFSLTLLLSLILRRGFCSWACPIGAISEYAHALGRSVLGRNFALPLWLDVPVRGVKYLLLAFFLFIILAMPAKDLAGFIHDPYNRIVDVKMYAFFASPSGVTIFVLAVLLALSVLVKNFWCRYLCPYGALAGLVSLLSPAVIRRNASACTSCGRCTRACPNRLPVAAKGRIRSAECTACYTCVSACPTRGALAMTLGTARRRLLLPAFLYGLLTVGVFLLVSQSARALNYWQSDTTPEQYQRLNAHIDEITHPTGPSPRRHPNHTADE